MNSEKTAQNEIIRLQEENKQLIDALEYYGNEKNYEDHKYWGIILDGGKTARKALRYIQMK